MIISERILLASSYLNLHWNIDLTVKSELFYGLSDKFARYLGEKLLPSPSFITFKSSAKVMYANLIQLAGNYDHASRPDVDVCPNGSSAS